MSFDPWRRLTSESGRLYELMSDGEYVFFTMD